MQFRGRYGGKIRAIAASAATVVIALGVDARPVAAEGLFSWLLGEQPRSEAARVSEPRPQSSLRTKRKSRESREARIVVARLARKTLTDEGVNPEPPPAPLDRPLFAVVSISDQSLSIYNRGGLVVRSGISSGMPGHSTPTGLFTIIGRERMHASNIYSGAPMPFMQRITWSGIAMHQGVVPGHPASHGCIRLPAGFAAKLWGMTRIGERVVISPQAVTPEEFSHPSLPTPKMRALLVAGEAAPVQAAPAPVAVAEGPILPAAQDSVPASAAALEGRVPPAAQASASTPAAAAAPQLLNPHRYAEQLKLKSVAEAAALAKTVKETAALIGVKQQEAVRAAAELRAAEFALESVRAKAVAAADAYDAAAVAAEAESAKPRDTILASAEVKASETDAMGAAKTSGPTKAEEAAKAAKEIAAIARTNAEAALAAAAARFDAAKTASLVKPEEAKEAVRRLNEATAAASAALAAEKEAVRRMAPVSVLISKKDRRIYVRQGLAPVFDAPASVRDPERPLGTHLFIATGANEDGASLKWSVLSFPARIDEEQGEHRKKKAAGLEDAALLSAPRWSTPSPTEALERIDIAPEARDRIAELLWTGGSIIVSDQPPSGETGAVGTDLTVKLR